MDANLLALAVDLGGTNLRAALVDRDGVILHEERTATRADAGPDAVIARVADTVARVVAATGAPEEVGIGVAAPGPLNPRTGVVYFCPNLPGWRDTPLRAQLAQLTSRDVQIGNDANAAALGEYYFGSRKSVANLIYVGLGTGVGGGVISDGALIDGALGMGGELGHTTVSIDGPRCHCGGAGCIEAYCSAWALTAEAELLIGSRRGHGILAAAGDQPVGPRVIGQAARSGDADALRLLQRAGTALGAGLANFVNIFNPEAIVIGGGLAELDELLLEPTRAALRIYGLPVMAEHVEVTRSTLDAKSGIYGAAALVFHGR
jgi:glucokinase